MYQNKYSKNINRKNIQKLPSEIFIKILENIETINDLINVYDIFYNNKITIINEIDNYLKLVNFNDKKKNWLFKILYFHIESNIKLYLHEVKCEIRKNCLKNINELYEEHEIYKIIIDFYLKCNICEYKYNKKYLYVYKDFHECINCNNILCDKCCVQCINCDPNKNIIFYHCLYCKNECLETIRQEINKLNDELDSGLESDDDDEDFEKLRKLKLKYCKNILYLAYENKIYMDIDKKIDYTFKILDRKDYEKEKKIFRILDIVLNDNEG